MGGGLAERNQGEEGRKVRSNGFNRYARCSTGEGCLSLTPFGPETPAPPRWYLHHASPSPLFLMVEPSDPSAPPHPITHHRPHNR